MTREDVTRRNVLQYIGTGGAAATVAGTAGCLGSDDEPSESGDTDSDGDSDSDGSSDGEMDSFELTVTQGQLTDTLDPVGDSSDAMFNILDQAYDLLIYRDFDENLVSHLATEWERIDDQSVRLVLREDVQFHNGDDLTAEDAAFTLQRAGDPDVSAIANLIGNITGARAEDGDVIVELGSVVPAIFRNLTAFGRVIQREWFEENDGDISTIMNGTSAYELEEFVDDTRVAFTKNDNFWGEEPDADEVVFNSIPESGPRIDALLGGDSDLIVNVDPDSIGNIQNDDSLSVINISSTRNIFLQMNDVFEHFQSREFRRALNYAVDVQSIIDSILNGFGSPTGQVLLEGHTGHNPDIEPYPYDPERAEELIDESGYAGTELTLHTPVGRYLKDVDVADAAASQIDELPNVSCTVERRDFGSLVGEILSEDQEDAPGFSLLGWSTPTFDAAYTMNTFFIESIWRMYRNDELEQLLIEADNTPSGEERTEMLQEASQIVHDEAAWLFLHQQENIYGINSDRIDWQPRSDGDIWATEINQA